MGKVLFFILFFLCIHNVNAQDSFFQKFNTECFIQSFKNGQLSDVDEKPFYDQVLKVKQLPRNPMMVAFKWDNIIYVTPKNCVAEKESSAENQSKSVTLPAPVTKRRAKETFISFDFGRPFIGDDSQVSGDYNETFPSVTTNPTTWGKAERSNYSTGMAFSGTVGFRQTGSRFLAFKIRSFTGKKIDSLSLTDINSGVTEEGSWIYEDRFINFYTGFHFQFLPNSYWRPTLSGYLGVSRSTSTMTDNSVTFHLNSWGLAILAEAGIERVLNESWSIGTGIGLEYLGPRSLKFEDNDDARGFKTKMSYNNINLSLGVKYAF